MSTMGGDFVREARKRAGITQTELATRAGTTQPGIARWESGRTAISLDDVIRLVRHCGFDLDLMLVPFDDSDLIDALTTRSMSVAERMRHQRNLRDLTERLNNARASA